MGRPPLRVVLVTRCYPTHQIGGMERHARDLALGMSARGDSVEVWTTSHPKGLLEERQNGVLVRYFPDTPPGIHSNRFGEAVLEELKQERDRIDLLLSMSRSAEMALLRLKPPVRPPAVMFMHGTQVSEELCVIATDRGKGGYLRFFTQRLPAILSSLARARAHFAAERVICVSEFVMEHLARVYRAPKSKLRLVRTGIPLPPRFSETDKLKARQELCLTDAGTVLLCIGRLAPDKGFDLALRAAEKLPKSAHWSMLIVGGGPDENRLRSIAESTGIAGRVRFTGPVPNEQTGKYYAAADVLVIPSVRYEGLPYVLIEGAAAGLAVVGTDRGGLGSEIKGRDIALVVKTGSVGDLAEALRSLVERPDLRARLGDNIRRHAETYYTLDAMLDGLDSVVAEII